MKPYQRILACEEQIAPGITACQGCNVELTLRTVMRVIGKNSILAIPPGCMGGTRVVGWADESGCKVPVFFPMLTNTASMLAGIKMHYTSIGRDDVHVVGFAGDGGTVDIGFQALSGAAERGDNIIYICYDNEGYMNTGYQRSSSTTKGAATSTTPVGKVIPGKRQHKKDFPMIMAMHDLPYMATCSPAYIPDMMAKVEKAKNVKNGLAYLHVFNTCSSGWGGAPEKSVESCRMSVQTRYFPLFEVENGKFKITVPVKSPKPVGEFLKYFKKFKHLTVENIQELQARTDEKWERLVALTEIGRDKEAAAPADQGGQ